MNSHEKRMNSDILNIVATLSRISDMSNYSSIKFCVHVGSTDGNIRDCLLLNCRFIISDVTQSIVLQIVLKPVKNNIFSFSVGFFS